MRKVIVHEFLDTDDVQNMIDTAVADVTKTSIGLGNVDNTSDASKPISSATGVALDGKSDISHDHDGTYVKPADLGDLAVKDKAAVADIDATGAPGSTTFLRGDGSWQVPAGSSSAVDSVNEQTGVVVLDADDISDSGTVNKFTTASDISRLANTSGTNTGDQDLSPYATIGAIPTSITDLDTTVDGSQLNALKVKVDGIATGAEVNVQSDWNAASGDAHILNKPTLGTASAQNSTAFATSAQGAKADSAVQPGSLSPVATSGAYGDLSGKPTIPAQFNPIAGSNVSLSGTYPNITFSSSGSGGGGGAVDSVNGQTGVVVLNADHIDDSATTNRFVTAADVAKLGNLSGTNTGDQVLPGALTDLDTTVTGAQLNALKTKVDGIAAGAEVNVNADWNAASGDAQILNKPTLGTAAAQNVSAFATATQGAKADTAVQPAAIASFETTTQLNARDTANRSRANHTGTQAISTIAATGTASATTYLRGDGSWSTPTNTTYTEITTAEIDAGTATTPRTMSGRRSQYIVNKARTGLVLASSLSLVATSGNYADLSGKPTLGTAAAADSTVFATAAQGTKADSAVQPAGIANFETTTQLNTRDTNNRNRANHSGTQAASTITGLATVATSGAYADLSGAPAVPALAGDGVAVTASRSDHYHQGAGGYGTVAIGEEVQCAGASSVAIGGAFGTNAYGNKSVSIGSQSRSNSHGTAVGWAATADGDKSVAIGGDGATANGAGSIALGTRSYANNDRAIAIGTRAGTVDEIPSDTAEIAAHTLVLQPRSASGAKATTPCFMQMYNAAGVLVSITVDASNNLVVAPV